MAASKTEGDEYIDLNKLTQRELLILLAKDVKYLKQNFNELDDTSQEMVLKINSLEVKSKVWGAIAGFISALALLGIDLIIERFFHS